MQRDAAEQPATLLHRMERRRAEREGQAPRTLQEIDYLLLVGDEARQGALRFAEREGGPFLREEGVKRIPLLVELPKLLSAAEHVIEDKDTDEDLRLLFAPGASLGGAGPKASVWESQCCRDALKPWRRSRCFCCGVDRDGARRSPFLSAMSMLGSKGQRNTGLSGNRGRVAPARGGAKRRQCRRCGDGWFSIF
jgi:hypothetical protein